MRTLPYLKSDRFTDPYPYYRWYRENLPVDWSEEIEMFCVYKYEDIKHILRNNDSFTVEYPFRISRQIFGETLLDIDGEKHQRLRKLTASIFSAENVISIQRMIIKPVVEEIINEVSLNNEVEFVRDVAEKLPGRVICRFLDLDENYCDWVNERIFYLTYHLDGSRGNFETASRYRLELDDFLTDQFRKSFALKKDRGFLNLCSISDAAPFEEILRLGFLLLAAGIETSVCSLSNVVHTLVSYPDCAEKMRSVDGYIGAFVQEVLRWEPPQHDTVRFAKEDIFVRNTLIPEGTPIKLILASGNRDEDIFSDADQFNPEREKKLNLSFGFGTHACLGKFFASKEMETLLSELTNRFSVISFSGDKPDPVTGYSFRKPERLLLTFE
jgi:cytochrome P450